MSVRHFRQTLPVLLKIDQESGAESLSRESIKLVHSHYVILYHFILEFCIIFIP